MKTALERQRDKEEALRASKARFRTIVSQATAGVAQTDMAGRFVLVNARYCEIVGYSGPELLGMRMQDITHPDDLARNLEQFHCLVNGGPDFIIEKRYVRKDGSAVWVNNSVGAVRDTSGVLQSAAAVVLDITERKRMEQLQVEQHHVLECIASGRPLKDCLMLLTDAVTRLQPNARAGVLLADEARTKFEHAIAAHIPPSFGQGLHGMPINELAIGTCGTAVHAGEPITCTDIAGSEHWSKPWRDLCVAHGILACHSTPVFRADGKAIASFFICFGEARGPNEWELRLAEFGAHASSIVIERDRSLRVMQDSEARFRTIVETTPECVKLVAADGTLLHMSPSGLTMVEADCAEMVTGKNLYDLIAPEHREAFRAFNEHICRGEKGSLQFDIVGLKGTRRHMETNAAPLRNPDGTVVHLAVTRDITERKRAEEALRQGQAALEFTLESAIAT